VSSKGELAVLTRTRYRSHRTYIGTLARMPLAEASPREILSDVTAADWFPDGTGLAVIRQVPGRSRLEYPIGTVLAESTAYLSDVRVSPKGDFIAFMSHAFEWDDRGPVVVVDRAGAVVAKSPEYTWEEGLTWSADGATVLFAASDQGANYSVRALAMDGTVRDVLTDPTGLIIHDTTSDGRLLVSTFIERASVVALFPGAPAERNLPTLETSFFPVLSRDGRSLIFTDQSRLAGPHYSVYLRPADGSPPVRLGEGQGVDFSPDGALVAVVVMSDPPRLMIYPTGAGEPRDISAAGFAAYDYVSARFLPDGHGVAFCGAEAGKASRCYVRDLAGGAARAVTPEGTDHGLVSPDGRAVVARGTDGRYQLYPLDGSGPTRVPGLDDGDYLIAWRPDGRSLLVYRPMEIPTRVERLDLSTGQRTLVRELAPVDPVGVLAVYGVSFSADEKSYAYAVERAVGALYVVEGVR
jgi:Tol biopolymer transport system component